jgi:hypothetical protein
LPAPNALIRCMVSCLEILIASGDHAPVECICVWPGIAVRCESCADVKTTKIAFLVARRAISSITDRAGLKRYAAEVGPVSDEDLEELEVRLKWGRVKEPFAIRAMKNQLYNMPELHQFFRDTYVVETGFTSCANGCVQEQLLKRMMHVHLLRSALLRVRTCT